MTIRGKIESPPGWANALRNPRTALVLVHGLMSSSKTWASFIECIEADAKLNERLDTLPFDYWSPKFRANPLRTIPSFDTVAEQLHTFIRNETIDYSSFALLTHSQGGLLAQRYIARAVAQHEDENLEKLLGVIMFACPNSGSDFFTAARTLVRGFWNHPHERELEPFNALVNDTQRIVMRRCLTHYHEHGSGRPIPVIAIAGSEDGIVKPGTAHSCYPDIDTVPGDHNSLIQVTATHQSYKTFARRISEFLAAARPVETHKPIRQKYPWQRSAFVDHDELFGVQQPLEQIRQKITSESSGWVISIFGAGGAGKTTLAYEATKRYALESGFQNIAWISAKSSALGVAGTVEQLDRTEYNWRGLLNDLAIQLDLIGSPSASIESDFPRYLRALDGKALIVIDNLESVQDGEYAVNYIEKSGILEPNKVIITTRDSISHLSGRVSPLVWNRLPEPAARSFADYLARANPEFTISESEMNDLMELSNGNPLIIKLTVRLCLDLNQSVGESLRRVRSLAQANNGSLASYLYDQSLLALQRRVGEQVAAKLLNSFCGRAPGTSVSADEFFKLSGIQDRKTFDEAKAAAGRLALLIASQGNTRFAIHSLLREFVCPKPDLSTREAHLTVEAGDG